ncbi:MAG: capsular polysaccharide biosynthesis protein [Fusobacteria bacterium]|nr:MAG: capsular polysaccharide biosynthesis protein [Fusobacteriota bacterium]KAF0229274.1 MAG: capsular polysaccharide biosynthesis [Fusobacteriota bacterium]
MEDYEEFSFIDFILRIKKRIVLVVGIIIVATIIPLVVGIVSYKPVYEAKTGIIVEMPRQDIDSRATDNTMYSSLMATYIQIAKTNNIAEMAASELKDITKEELLKGVDVTTEDSSMFMYISITNEDPNIAYKAVNAYAKAFLIRATELLPEGKLTIFDDSQKPISPINSNVKTINIAIGFVLGVMLSVMLAYILEELEIRKKISKISR